MKKKQKAPKKTRYSQAYKKAVEQISQDQVTEIKVMVKATLEKIQKLTKEREKVDTDLKLLCADLEDLKRGKVDKIKARHEKEKRAEEISPIKPEKVQDLAQMYRQYLGTLPPYAVSTGIAGLQTTTGTNVGSWSGGLQQAVSGSYTLNDGSSVHLE